MVSAKGKPTDPKLKEKVTEGTYTYLHSLPQTLTNSRQEVKNQPNKDGSGKGKMAAWKAAKIGKEYESRGGDYTNEPGSKDKPQKGTPVKKSPAEKKSETKEETETTKPGLHAHDNHHAALRLKKQKGNYHARARSFLCDVPLGRENEESESASGSSSEDKAPAKKPSARGRPSGGAPAKKGKAKEVKEPKKGERTSARQAGKKADENGKTNGDAGGSEKANRGKKRKVENGNDEEGGSVSANSKKSKKG
ncbi:hypothetical protein LOCC1_G008279 [Lachnellula occidentalis]|uniref:Uncharacterized protein n=1 Tax=Lachnellula occidentalis TaxID=215460 RepID=A0A8H8RFB3_9HELO|nr:hypothetical protein LOCC1_G008279 [Lachnellula occidentalis]